MTNQAITSGAGSLSETWVDNGDGTFSRLGATKTVDSSGNAVNALPAGRAAAASSVPTVLSNEDFARLGSVAFGGASTSVSSITSVASSTTLKASNAARTGILITNDSTSILYVLLGSGTASATNYSFAIAAKGTVASYVIVTGYTGQINGIWSAANGFAMVTEVS